MYLSVTFHTADDYALYKAFVNNDVVVTIIFRMQNYLSVLLRVESLYRSSRSDNGKHHIAVLCGVLSADDDIISVIYADILHTLALRFKNHKLAVAVKLLRQNKAALYILYGFYRLTTGNLSDKRSIYSFYPEPLVHLYAAISVPLYEATFA